MVYILSWTGLDIAFQFTDPAERIRQFEHLRNGVVNRIQNRLWLRPPFDPAGRAEFRPQSGLLGLESGGLDPRPGRLGLFGFLPGLFHFGNCFIDQFMIF